MTAELTLVKHSYASVIDEMRISHHNRSDAGCSQLDVTTSLQRAESYECNYASRALWQRRPVALCYSCANVVRPGCETSAPERVHRPTDRLAAFHRSICLPVVRMGGLRTVRQIEVSRTATDAAAVAASSFDCIVLHTGRHWDKGGEGDRVVSDGAVCAASAGCNRAEPRV
jgi:hypothetical protein